MKKIIGLLGLVTIVGAVVYIFCKLNKKEKMKKHDNDIISENTEKNEINDMEEKKSIVIQDISERHNFASNIMKDAMEIIYKNTKVDNQVDQDLKEISKDLDELLNGE